MPKMSIADRRRNGGQPTGVLEGLGGPVLTKEVDRSNIDPTLDSCCQREIIGNQRRSAVEQSLRRHDRVALAERRRRNLLDLSFGSGCRCCYDPESDGGSDYRALEELRSELGESVYRNEGEGDEWDENGGSRENGNVNNKDDDDDSEEDEFDYLLDEELPNDGVGGSISQFEERRRAELEFAAMAYESAHHHGYGVHRQMHPLRVLKASGLGMTAAIPSAAVVHLVDPDSYRSASLDLFLESLAQTYRGTKFLRSGGRSTLGMDRALCEQVLPRLHPEEDLPLLFTVKEGVVISVCRSLEELCIHDRVEPRAVEEWLDHSGVLLKEPPLLEDMCRIRPEEDALYDFNMQKEANQNSTEDKYYNCGVPGCQKAFQHEHVGVETDQQDGLLVKAQELTDPSINTENETKK